MWHNQRSHKKYGSFDHACGDCEKKFATAPALLARESGSIRRRRRQSLRLKKSCVNVVRPKLTKEVGEEKTALKCRDDGCDFVAKTFKSLRIHEGMAHKVGAERKLKLRTSLRSESAIKFPEVKSSGQEEKIVLRDSSASTDCTFCFYM